MALKLEGLNRLRDLVRLHDFLELGGDQATGPIVSVVHRGHRAQISLFGAHLLSWQPADHAPILWLSDDTALDQKGAIRGGVPICWPWFAGHTEHPEWPAHGFVRTAQWCLDEVSIAAERCVLSFTLPRVERDALYWPYQTRPRVMYAIGETMMMQLTTENCDAKPIDVGQALHTYFEISDVGNVSVKGLEGCQYVDKLTGAEQPADHSEIWVDREIDRIYRRVTGPVRLRDEGLGRMITIEHAGARNVIVWNPWQDKSIQLGDMGEDGSFRKMLCIETGTVAPDQVLIQPGQEYVLETTLSVARL